MSSTVIPEANRAMNERLTWFELSRLKPGAVVAFGCEFHVTTRGGEVAIAPGTACVLEDNGLNEIWGGVIVKPLDPVVEKLLYHQDQVDGLILISDTPEPGGADDPDGDPRWGALSPFIIHETCPVECI